MECWIDPGLAFPTRMMEPQMKLVKTALLASMLATASAGTALAASDTNPIFGGAKTTQLTSTENKAVTGKGTYANYYGYYGNLYAYNAYYYSYYARYVNAANSSSETNNYYTAYYYSYYATNNLYNAYYYSYYGQ
jgi:hypothetical protein